MQADMLAARRIVAVTVSRAVFNPLWMIIDWLEIVSLCVDLRQFQVVEKSARSRLEQSVQKRTLKFSGRHQLGLQLKSRQLLLLKVAGEEETPRLLRVMWPHSMLLRAQLSNAQGAEGALTWDSEEPVSGQF